MTTDEERQDELPLWVRLAVSLGPAWTFVLVAAAVFGLWVAASRVVTTIGIPGLPR